MRWLGLQGFGYAFFFVPLTVIAYSQLTPQQNNKASSLTNFFRNWAGSVGVLLVTTMAERRQDLHQSRVGDTIAGSSEALQSRGETDRCILFTTWLFAADAMTAAYSHYYNQLIAQTRLLGFYGLLLHSRRNHVSSGPAGPFTKYFKVGGGSSAAH